MLRINEGVWSIAAKHDVRRGLWFRIDGPVIEICAGREGDDSYVQIQRDRVGYDIWAGIRDVLEYAAYARGINGLPETTREDR